MLLLRERRPALGGLHRVGGTCVEQRGLPLSEREKVGGFHRAHSRPLLRRAGEFHTADGRYTGPGATSLG